MNISNLHEYLQGCNNGIIWEELLEERINDSKCIEKYGFKVYSQNDEDGIIEEIFERIGTTNKRFIEFGVQDGIESNGHYLLLKDWNGFWIECDEGYYQKITEKFDDAIKAKQLSVVQEFITKDNINQIFERNGQSGEIDLLSIDIDGNDYHIWREITAVNPRVVVIEYNAKIPPSCEWVMPYCEQHRWDGGDKHGASLLALEKLGKEKGYVLVGTNISGVNAFFVRKDCSGNKFTDKSVKQLYNSPRYYKKYYAGHPSLYCLKNIPEGRKQLFCGQKETVLFYEGFYGQETQEKYTRWMSQKKSCLYIKDENNSISKMKLYLQNPCIIIDKQKAPQFISIRIENEDAVIKKLQSSEEIMELEVQRASCRNDDILEVMIEIDSLWCPQKVGMQNDNRNLGILLAGVEFT